MKPFSHILSLVGVFLVLSGCQTNDPPKDAKPNISSEYDFINEAYGYAILNRSGALRFGCPCFDSNDAIFSDQIYISTINNPAFSLGLHAVQRTEDRGTNDQIIQEMTTLNQSILKDAPERKSDILQDYYELKVGPGVFEYLGEESSFSSETRIFLIIPTDDFVYVFVVPSKYLSEAKEIIKSWKILDNS